MPLSTQTHKLGSERGNVVKSSLTKLNMRNKLSVEQSPWWVSILLPKKTGTTFLFFFLLQFIHLEKYSLRDENHKSWKKLRTVIPTKVQSNPWGKTHLNALKEFIDREQFIPKDL